MKNKLIQILNIPVTSESIASLYPNIKTKWKKIEQLEKEGEIIRLKRNLFVANPNETGIKLSLGLIANNLHAPSYVSMSTALRYYGLIPEAVYTTQSMTFKTAKNYNTPAGIFSYKHIAKETYPIGLVQIKENNIAYIMASPEKALCDLIACTPGLNLRFKQDAQKYLEDDLRLDMEKFYSFNKDILLAYAQIGKKSTSIKTILKLLDNE